MIVISVYVDDILLKGADISQLNALKFFLYTEFKIKNFGNVHYFFGLEIDVVATGFLVSQRKHTSDLLTEFHFHNYGFVSTPLDSSIKLLVDMGADPIDATLYRRIVGKLNFLQHTRLDISFSVQNLDQFSNKPQIPHMMAVRRVLCYLLNSLDQGILPSSSSDFFIVAYSDSDWASCANS